jgi:hypothetical protein
MPLAAFAFLISRAYGKHGRSLGGWVGYNPQSLLLERSMFTWFTFDGSYAALQPSQAMHSFLARSSKLRNQDSYAIIIFFGSPRCVLWRL